MKIIYNKILPFGDFLAINICGLLFVKADKGATISYITLNHESIHTAQIKEMWYVGFYLWYFIEWLYQWIAKKCGANIDPYYHITMEQEAYDNEGDFEYLTTRKPFAWLKYLGSRKTY